MPEAAEVRVIAEYLNKEWSNRLIAGLGWDEKSKFAKPKRGIKGLELVKVPCRVVGVFSRGKLIIIECINAANETIYMVSQLGMEGKWIHTKGSHSNFRVYFGDLSEDKTKYEVTDRWYYDDSRHFGHFNVYSDMGIPGKDHGPCLLTTALVNSGTIDPAELRPYQLLATLDLFKTKIKNKRMNQNKQLCIFIMEQKYVSGIGNYLRAEILYRCKMHPRKTVGSFTDEQISNLYDAILEQMLIAYGARGLTIKSYWDPEGNAGKCPLQVYNREEDLLGNPVERIKEYPDKLPPRQGRTVHWVPTVQTIK